MAQAVGRATPEELARELRHVLKLGNRAPKLVYRLGELPALCRLTGKDPVSERWECAIAVVELVCRAAGTLGDGPYGRAAQALLGTVSETRGLPHGRRRKVAADELGVSEATLIRHWERQMILDTAVSAWRVNGPHDL